MTLEKFLFSKYHKNVTPLHWPKKSKYRVHAYVFITTLPNLTKVRPLFTLSHRGSDNSPLLIVFSANYINQSIVTFMRLKVG